MTPRKPAKKAAKRTAKPTAGKRGAGAAGKRPAPRAKAADVGRQASRARTAAPELRPLPVFEFTAGEIAGYLRLSDPDRGFEFSGAPGGRSLPTTCKEVLSLRHYLARGNGGLLTPREEADCDGKVDKNGIVFRYQPTAKWPVEATVRYELLSQGGLDATFAFDFRKDLNGFEAGVETVVPRTYAGVHVHAGGRWVATAAGPRLKRFYPRNLGAAELIADGRWSGFRRAGIGLAVEPQGYDYPMVVVWETNGESAIAWMALTEECSSVWVNGADRTIGMGLGGANVKAGSSCTCRLRVLLCRISQLDDVLPYYREFVQAARSSRQR